MPFGTLWLPAAVFVLSAVAHVLLPYHRSDFKRLPDVDDYATFQSELEGGGFFRAHWCEDGACELKVKEETKATIRVIPLDAAPDPGACMKCGRPSPRRVVFARAY